MAGKTSSPLPTRPLGKTGMNITRLGLGTWAIGGPNWAFGWGAQDDELSLATIRRTLELGLNWIDTSAVYGLGHAEEVVSRILHEIPRAEWPYVFTKGSLVWDERDHNIPPRRIGNPASLRREVEASLRRLQVDRIDLYQMHWPADDTPLEVYWQTLLDLKREGKLLPRGAVQPQRHATRGRRAARPRRNAAAAVLGHPPRGRGGRVAVVRRAQYRGDRLQRSAEWAADRVVQTVGAAAERLARARPDYNVGAGAEFAGEPLRQNLALADALKPIAARHGVTPAAIAAAWTLAWPGVTGAIMGARRPAQVDGWISAATLELSRADLQEIADAIASTGAGAGPALPPQASA